MELLDNDLIQKSLRVIIIALGGFAVSRVVNTSINIFFGKLMRRSTRYAYRSRLNTMRSITKSVVGFLTIGVFALLLLSEFGFNTAPIIAGAGILGLAISFGSQTLVKDLIAGFFLIIENQINIGDKVKIDDTEGRVVKMLMRNIIIEDKNGNKVFVPNSEIKKIIVLKEKL